MEHRRPSLIGPLILITAGVLLLLANAGMLPFSFWEIAFRFWPLLLILIGLEILFGRRSWLGALVVIVLWVAVIGGVLWVVNAQGGGMFVASPGATDPIAQPLGDIKSASVDLQMAFSDMHVGSLGVDSGDLVKGTFQHSEGKRVVQNYAVVGSEGRLILKEEGSAVAAGPWTSRWDIGLNAGVPLAIRLNGGVGRNVLDLSELTVTSLALDTGIGSLDVTAPKTGSVSLRLNGGLGSARVTVPPGVAATIRASAGLGGIQVDTARFPKFGDHYQSADYASATNKIDIDVDGGFGSITVR